jgi:NAD-dependent SIR2 family protein deacetylase
VETNLARTETKPQSHLINILRATRDHHPNFALFLGAGASVTSGVKTTTEMIAEWRQRHHEMYRCDSSEILDTYLRRSQWYKAPEEYSLLFEALYDQPSQRREYIESCLKDAHPSWGYIYLVNLIAQGVFNTVFTTNFDDLLNEACYTFSNIVRPIVCAHDSSIRSVRITAKRPKIVKLHGDFLFDNIKNTLNELESLEDNMRDKFRQCAAEFGLIVVGYSGNDRSVMDSLNTLLRSDSNFPHGVYWCCRKNSKLSKGVENLRRFPRFKLIEVNGFDEFFADVHEGLGLQLQPEMSDPYGTLVKKLNRLMDDTNIPASSNLHPVIARDIQTMGKKIAAYSEERDKATKVAEENNDITFKVDDVLVRTPIPFELLAQIKKREGQLQAAIKYLVRELKVRPSERVFTQAFVLIAEGAGGKEDEDQLLDLLQNAKSVLVPSPSGTFNMALPLIKHRNFELARKILDIGYQVHQQTPSAHYDVDHYRLNLLQIKAHQDVDFTEEEKAQLISMASSGNPLTSMGANILLKEWEKAEEQLAESIAKGSLTLPDVSTWPIFDLIRPFLKSVVPPVVAAKPEKATDRKKVKSIVVPPGLVIPTTHADQTPDPSPQNNGHSSI